jgi:ElaB/YqjD/DUF883 family membrane-anchored ribosome-binding protein
MNAAPEALESGISQKLRDLIVDMGDLIKSGGSLTAEELARAKAKFRARLAAARDSLEGLSVRARETAQAADRYVREQPWQVIGMTVAAGWLVGFLYSRRGR